MFEKLAGHSYYFLGGYSSYFHIAIAPEDQENTIFTCLFGTFAYRRMPFGVCNALTTCQKCMLSIFSYYIENFIELFMDDLQFMQTSLIIFYITLRLFFKEVNKLNFC